MNDLDYIKSFSKITIAEICREMKITPSNLWAGRLNEEKVKLVRKKIEAKIGTLYINELDKMNGK